MKLIDFINTIDKLIDYQIKKFGDGVIISYLKEKGKKDAKFYDIYVPFVSDADETEPILTREVDDTKNKIITGEH